MMPATDRALALSLAVRAALAEAGYPHAQVSWPDPEDPGTIEVVWLNDDSDVPAVVIWRAFAVIGVAQSCWPCAQDGLGPCSHHIEI